MILNAEVENSIFFFKTHPCLNKTRCYKASSNNQSRLVACKHDTQMVPRCCCIREKVLTISGKGGGGNGTVMAPRTHRFIGLFRGDKPLRRGLYTEDTKWKVFFSFLLRGLTTTVVSEMVRLVFIIYFLSSTWNGSFLQKFFLVFKVTVNLKIQLFLHQNFWRLKRILFQICLWIIVKLIWHFFKLVITLEINWKLSIKILRYRPDKIFFLYAWQILFRWVLSHLQTQIFH